MVSQKTANNILFASLHKLRETFIQELSKDSVKLSFNSRMFQFGLS